MGELSSWPLWLWFGSFDEPPDPRTLKSFNITTGEGIAVPVPVKLRAIQYDQSSRRAL
jgi:hypothetical protein